MVKKKGKILELLNTAPYGMSVQNMAKKLGWHRNTVSKYLTELRSDGKVKERKVGQYKIWINKESQKKSKSPQNLLLLKAYRLLLKNLRKIYHDMQDGKELGRLIGKELNIENYISLNGKDYSKKNLDLSSLAEIFMDALNTIYLFTYEKYTFDPPLTNEKPPFIIIRIRDRKYIEIPLHYQLVAGLFEEKIAQLYRLNVDISLHEIFLDEGIIDIKITLL